MMMMVMMMGAKAAKRTNATTTICGGAGRKSKRGVFVFFIKGNRGARSTSTSSSSSSSSPRSPNATPTTPNATKEEGGKKKPLKLLSWNVNGLRSTIANRPSFLADLENATNGFDVLALQETKLQESHAMKLKADAEEWTKNAQFEEVVFSCSKARKGYSGVALILANPRVKVLKTIEGFHEKCLDVVGFEKTEENVAAFELFNREGRLVTCALETAVVINAYVPNSGEGLKRLRERIEVWEPAMKAHVECVKKEMKNKPIVWLGDFNVAHEKNDLWGNWTQNESSAGFTPQERRAFSKQLEDLRLTDSFRYKHPTAKDTFTYWSYRAKSRERNRGWRIDYALVSEEHKEDIRDAFVVSTFTGSDHCPLGVEIDVLSREI